MFLPEDNPINQVGSFMMGQGNFIMNAVKNNNATRRGGLGSSGIRMNAEIMNAREHAMALLGQSVTHTMLGREASLMHN